MTAYIMQHVCVSRHEADRLRVLYWQRYGATLAGLVRHHGIHGNRFLRETHTLPGLEERLQFSHKQLKSIVRLGGEKWVYTNGPRAYALRVLKAAGIAHEFKGVWSIENSWWCGHYHPKPSPQALRRLLVRLRISPHQCVLVDDSPVNLNTAARLGLKTVWMHGYHTPAETRTFRRQLIQTDAQIQGLDALPALEQRWQTRAKSDSSLSI